MATDNRMSSDSEPIIILASSSEARRSLLEKAGIPHSVEPSKIDEVEVKKSLRAEGITSVELAETLANLKATTVSRNHPGKLVLGVDQTLDLDNTIFDKPRDFSEAAAQLKYLRGQSHHLTTYAVIAQDGLRIWSAVDTARLTIRANMSDQFINNYLACCGINLLSTAGLYKVESVGVQLFSKIEGSHYTILGLPLLSLLDYLRENGVLEK
tara:strand:+ start:435 stop:1067 length:633 start_codon:yes stop_codon:yes gene_type:complete